MDIRQEVLEAEGRIREFIRETPLEYSPYLSRLTDARVFLKLENIQISGSFKLRGAMNKILSLSETQKKRGVVTASSGNHGSAFAYTLDKFGLKGRIYLPNYASKAKVDLLRQYHSELEFYGDDCMETELYAKQMAAELDQEYVSPYNDLKIVGGQGTIAVELLRQLGEIDTIILPVGGGGLASGVAGYLKSVQPEIETIGCLPENSPVMYESVRAGKIVEMESLPTLSDGTAGGIEPGSITFDICRDSVDEYILITEEEIKHALRLFIEKHCMLIEGAAALPVAALSKHKDRFAKKNVVLVISGAKISLETLREVLN